MIRYFAFCQGDILLTEAGEIPCGENPPVRLKPWQTVTSITSPAGDECRAIRLDAPVSGEPGLRMTGLRQAYGLLPGEDYRLAGKCQELIYWDQTSRYCGACGMPLEWQTSISKQCPSCGKEWWPSLALAIIVRVSRGQEILMVHSRNFRCGRMIGQGRARRWSSAYTARCWRRPDCASATCATSAASPGPTPAA